MIGSISIDFDEGDPTSYRGVKIHTSGQKNKKLFATGRPAFDYACGLAYLEVVHKSLTIMGSSSCDHFVMDGGNLEIDDAIWKEVQLHFLEQGWINLDYQI